MNGLAQIFTNASRLARGKRDIVFLSSFPWVDPETRILDLGSQDGANIARVLAGCRITPANVHVADLNVAAVTRAHQKFGFTPVVLSESGALPFPDAYFDIVYCSSVIEHVTIPKREVWSATNGRAFRSQAMAHQKAFAAELRRVSKAYFVQTPNRAFPIESHTWLPLIGYLPRRMLIPMLHLTNRIWIKRTAPDWNLLQREDMAALFPDAEIVTEKAFGMTKSFMAIRTGRIVSSTAPSPENAFAPPLTTVTR
jgi:hypothetical protein